MTVPLLSPAIDKPEWITGMEAVLEVLNEGVVRAATKVSQLEISVFAVDSDLHVDPFFSGHNNDSEA